MAIHINLLTAFILSFYCDQVLIPDTCISIASPVDTIEVPSSTTLGSGAVHVSGLVASKCGLRQFQRRKSGNVHLVI